MRVSRSPVNVDARLPEQHRIRMADVRSMLRAERAARRLTHPHASYTNDGKLHCNLCEVPVKSETQWQSHLHSTQHNLRSQRERDAASLRSMPVAPGSKKRKADEIESSPVDDRKKSKSTYEGRDGLDDSLRVIGTIDGSIAEDVGVNDSAPSSETPIGEVPAAQDEIDDEEFAAFEREIAELESRGAEEPTRGRVRFNIDEMATIAAAPVAADESGAQPEDNASTKRSKRDVELEDEREDAARLIEEELEEMESLEERVRRLRDRREALRNAKSQDTSEQGNIVSNMSKKDKTEHVSEENEEDDSEYDDEDWNFGAA